MDVRLWMGVALAVGCSSKAGTIQIEEPGDTIPGDDTGQDTDAGDPMDSVDFSVWEGRRTLYNGDCAGVLAEEGEHYTEEWEYYESSKEVCPECDHFYGIQVTPSYVCDIPQSSFAYRALDIQDDGTVDLLYWSDSEGAYVVFAERGSFEGTTLYYEYDWDYYDTPLRYEGRVLFEELEPEN